jgi:hypothetical protein
MSLDYDEEFEITCTEVGGCKVAAFCPICRIQVIGYTAHAVVHDLVDHLNEFHQRSEETTVSGKYGSA